VLLPPAREVNISDMQPTIRPRARSFARCCARARSTIAKSRSKVSLLAPQMEIMAPPGWRTSRASCRGCSSSWAAGAGKLKKMSVAEALRR
jgi:hypothetical protein